MRLTTEEGKSVFSYILSELPGCDGAAVVHGLYRSSGVPGFATKAGIKRDKQIFDSGYSAIVCTVNMDNVAQLHTLEKRGWKQIYVFKNNKTGNSVGIYILSKGAEE